MSRIARVCWRTLEAFLAGSACLGGVADARNALEAASWERDGSEPSQARDDGEPAAAVR
jgi:hypothetical protein